MNSEEAFLAYLQRINEDTSSSGDEIKGSPVLSRSKKSVSKRNTGSLASLSLPSKSRRSPERRSHGSHGLDGRVSVPSELPRGPADHNYTGTPLLDRIRPPSDRTCETLPDQCPPSSQQASEDDLTSFETCPEGPITVGEVSNASTTNLTTRDTEKGRLVRPNKSGDQNAKSRSSSTATTISWMSSPENARMVRQAVPSRVGEEAKVFNQSGADAGRITRIKSERPDPNEHEETTQNDASQARVLRRSVRMADNRSQERSNTLEQSRRKPERRVVDSQLGVAGALTAPSPERRLRTHNIQESPEKQALTQSVPNADLASTGGSKSTRRTRSQRIANQQSPYHMSPRGQDRMGFSSAALISPPRRRGSSGILHSIVETKEVAASFTSGKTLAVDMENSYEVPDSQPDNMPATPPPSTPRKRGLRGRENVESFKTKPDRRRPADSQSPEDPYRMEVFRLVKKVDVSPFRPDLDGNRRKKRRGTSPRHDEDTPPMTPARPSPSITNTTPRSMRSADDLDAAIQEVRSNPDALEGVVEADDEELKADKPIAVQYGSTSNSWQKTFACMHANDGTSSTEGPNANTIAILQRMAEHYERTRDAWRTLAYRKAIGALKKQEEAVTTSAQALKIPGIGARLADKIEEISRTSKLKQLEHAESDPDVAVLKAFTQVYGAGLVQARSWIAKGFRTLDDLGRRADLTPTQKIGLEHYDDFLRRIPRDEVRAHGALVDDALLQVSSKLRLTVAGSYRRGSATSGDIDFMITTIDEDMADQVLRSMVFERLVPLLFKMGYLKATLAGHSSDKGSKWHGAACLPNSIDGVWRRVDILVVPPREWGAALLYFTGNDIFNRSMRLLARKKGMNLNQHGLYKDVLRGPGQVKLTRGTLVEGRDEERIFEALGVPYRPPEDRVC